MGSRLEKGKISELLLSIKHEKKNVGKGEYMIFVHVGHVFLSV